MIKNLGHAGTHRRVALNVGAGFVPGLNSVLMGAALAGGKLGWEMVGIRDGFEGLLHPDRYPDGGLVSLSPERVENLDPATAGMLGQAPAVDPFHAPASAGAEADLSDEILGRLQAAHVDAIVSAVGVAGLGIARASTRSASRVRSRTTSSRRRWPSGSTRPSAPRSRC
jgi:hypothetical protein